MVYRFILGGVLGALVGGIVGYLGRCSGGQCPLTCNPIGGIITGAILGVLLVGSISTAGK